MRFPCFVDYNTCVLGDVILRHTVFTHRSAILSARQNMLNSCGKNRYKLSVLRSLVDESDKAKKRNHDSGQKNCLRKVAVDRKVIITRKDGTIHWPTLNISVVVSLFLAHQSRRLGMSLYDGTQAGVPASVRVCVRPCVRPCVHTFKHKYL